jgi:hypothetical protein
MRGALNETRAATSDSSTRQILATRDQREQETGTDRHRQRRDRLLAYRGDDLCLGAALRAAEADRPEERASCALTLSSSSLRMAI